MDLELDLDPKGKAPDLRSAAGYALEVLRMMADTTSYPALKTQLGDLCEWLQRSFEEDPLGKVKLGVIEPNSLIVVWPAEKVETQQAEQLRDSLNRALDGKFVGAVFADPDMRVEKLDDETLEKLGLVRRAVMDAELEEQRFHDNCDHVQAQDAADAREDVT